LAKDVRTKYETADVDAVLDGDLDEFIKQYLSLKSKSGRFVAEPDTLTT